MSNSLEDNYQQTPVRQTQPRQPPQTPQQGLKSNAAYQQKQQPKSLVTNNKQSVKKEPQYNEAMTRDVSLSKSDGNTPANERLEIFNRSHQQLNQEKPARPVSAVAGGLPVTPKEPTQTKKTETIQVKHISKTIKPQSPSLLINNSSSSQSSSFGSPIDLPSLTNLLSQGGEPKQQIQPNNFGSKTSNGQIIAPKLSEEDEFSSKSSSSNSQKNISVVPMHQIETVEEQKPEQPTVFDNGQLPPKSSLPQKFVLGFGKKGKSKKK